MSAPSGREVEVKLALADAGEGQRRLEAAGFSVVTPRLFEANVLFDTSDRRLGGGASLLRVRQAGQKTLLTFKGPATSDKHKVREELETELSSAQAAAAILERLGFHPVFRYEKYRTEYAAAGQPGVVSLDETPIGDFFELEGPPEWIDLAAARLGFRENDYITASYAALYFAWCEQRRLEPAHMVFSGQV